MARKLVYAASAIAALAACVTANRSTAPAPAEAAASARAAPASESIPDPSLGLSKQSVFEVPSPPAVQPESSAPGERPPPPRAYPGAPPVIPHGIEDFLPITRDANACVDCHGVAVKEPGMPTPIPPSHYEDLRRAPGRTQETLVGARQVCTSCHLPGSDAAPVAGNAFGR